MPSNPTTTWHAGVALRLDVFGRLLVVDGDKHTAVRVQLCFPWTDPARFFSLRDIDDKELFLIEEPTQLDTASQTALLEAVQQVRFVFEITKVHEVTQDHELRLWRVDTEQGPRRFQTKLDDWPRRVSGHAWMIRDVGGDLYFISQIQQMDTESITILSAYLDADPA